MGDAKQEFQEDLNSRHREASWPGREDLTKGEEVKGILSDRLLSCSREK